MAQIGWKKDIEVQDFDGAKDGKYVFRIVDADCKIPKSNLGEMLSLELDIESGPSNGKHFENWCYVHENKTVEEIANQNIKRLQMAVGLAQLDDTDQLVGKKFSAELKTKGDYQNMRNIAAVSVAVQGDNTFDDELPNFLAK